MAFWSLYKWFGKFRKSRYLNVISWYSDSLKSPEQIEYERLKKRRNAANVLQTLTVVKQLIDTTYMY